MPNQPPPPGAANGDEHQADNADRESSRIQSITELGDRIGRLEDLIRGLGGRPPGPAAPPADQGQPAGEHGTLGEQVARLLDQRDARKRDEDASKEAYDRLTQVEQNIADLAERVPESPIRPVERFMQWR